ARRKAAVAWPKAFTAGGQVRKIGLEDGLIFWRQRGFLSAAPRLTRVECRLTGRRDTNPLAFQVGIRRVIKGLRAVCAQAQRPAQRDHADQASIKHDCPPAGRYFPVCLKYRRSGGGWPFLAGIRY